MSQLLMRCIETPGVSFAIVHGVSDNRFKFLDLTDTRQVLGYCPQDDAFQLFDTQLLYSDNWADEDLGTGRFTTASRPCGKRTQTEG